MFPINSHHDGNKLGIVVVKFFINTVINAINSNIDVEIVTTPFNY